MDPCEKSLASSTAQALRFVGTAQRGRRGCRGIAYAAEIGQLIKKLAEHSNVKNFNDDWFKELFKLAENSTLLNENDEWFQEMIKTSELAKRKAYAAEIGTILSKLSEMSQCLT